VVATGARNRVVKATNANERSSRSHMILIGEYCVRGLSQTGVHIGCVAIVTDAALDDV